MYKSRNFVGAPIGRRGTSRRADSNSGDGPVRWCEWSCLCACFFYGLTILYESVTVIKKARKSHVCPKPFPQKIRCSVRRILLRCSFPRIDRWWPCPVRQQQADAFIVSVNRGKTQPVYLCFHIIKEGERLIFTSNTVPTSQSARTKLEEEALRFAEDMGFMMVTGTV